MLYEVITQLSKKRLCYHALNARYYLIEITVKETSHFDALIPSDMAKKAEDVGVAKATKDIFSAFYLAITAGFFIGIAFIFYTTVTTGTRNNFV